MINIAICDDEEIMLYKIKDKISKVLQPDVGLMEFDLFYNPKKLIESYKLKFYDLIFLDVNMPELSGFETTEILQKNENKPNIIFITSINDYAFDAYLYSPIAFIRKDHIDKDLLKYKNSILAALKNNSVYYSYTLNNKIFKIKIGDIIYFESFKNYINIHTINQEIIKIKKPLKSIFEDVKADNLIQINKGFIVNITHINKIDKNSAITENNQSLPIGNTFYEDFKNKFKKDM